MRIFRSIGEFTPEREGTYLTIGNFDGVHIGHQRIIRAMVDSARAAGGQSLLLTFDPHPLNFFAEGDRIPMITTLRQRLDLIAALGVDSVIVRTFDHELAETDATDFIVRMLLGKLHFKELFVSSKFLFGRNARGDIRLLERLAGEHEFRLSTIENIYYRHTLVSSSFVRQAVLNGEIDLANQLLGRPYSLTGEVYPDRRRGAEILNCPTSNIRPENELIPAQGIYVSSVAANGKHHPAATYIGTRPTFGDSQQVVETHMLDFSGCLYRERITIEFFRKLRDDRKFESPEALRDQIHRDIEGIRAFFARHDADPLVPRQEWQEG